MVSGHSTQGTPIPQRGQQVAQGEQRASHRSRYTCTTHAEGVESRSPLSPLAPRQSPTAESVHRVSYHSAQDPNEAPAAPCSDHWNPADGDCCLCPVLLLRSDEWATRHNTPGRRQEVGLLPLRPRPLQRLSAVTLLDCWQQRLLNLPHKGIHTPFVQKKRRCALKRHLRGTDPPADQPLPR